MTEYPTFVYVITHAGSYGQAVAPIKVGISRNPKTRLGDLQKGNPNPLILHRIFKFPSRHGARYIERMFHKIESEKKICGEWFNIDPDYATDILRFHISLTIEVSEGVDGHNLAQVSPFCEGKS